jgi:hypothetical protein
MKRMMTSSLQSVAWQTKLTEQRANLFRSQLAGLDDRPLVADLDTGVRTLADGVIDGHVPAGLPAKPPDTTNELFSIHSLS